ncbi:MAG TPA: hypothetical protein VLF62_04415, partial [Candidatus Saccharimonadales bacterium]|nr:hypothetical protein [Candidatus Saccharimonadales bacterium]
FHAIVGGVALAGLGVAKVMAARHGMETGGGGHGMQWAVENVPAPSGNGNHTVAMENVSNTYGLGGEGADRHGKTIAKVMGGTAVIGAAVGTIRHLRHRSRDARHDAHQAHQDQQWQQAKHDRSEIAREGRQARNSSRRTGVPLVSGGRRLDLVDGTAHALNNRASNYDTAPRAPHVDPVNIDEIVGEHTIRRGRRYNRRHPGH